MKVAVMGFGVVGSGVAEVIAENAPWIEKNSGVSLELSHILDIRDFENNPFSSLMTKDFNDILNDSETDIVVETMGGVEPAFSFVSACLQKGKHVVSSNKELVAKKGFALLELARANNVNFLFEAAVGGGIPILRPISRCLAANRISEVAGILNGTTNFILTKMIKEHMEFGDALRLAQENGYAEKDPTADVEGIDACRKICILASLCFGTHVYPDGILTEGITGITLQDVAAAEQAGCVVKLIAQARSLQNGRLAVLVSPALVEKSSMLAGVNGVFNACLVRGDAVGDVVLYGQGAGKKATASAVVGDVIDCACNSEKRKVFGWAAEEPGKVEDPMNAPSTLFVRVEGRAEEAAALQKAFSNADLHNAGDGTFWFFTETAPEGELRKRLAESGAAIRTILRKVDY